MLLTNKLQTSPVGGRELLCKLNHDVLRDIYGGRLVVFELPRGRVHGFRMVINAFKGHIDGLCDSSIFKALETVQAGNVEKIFVDGSNLGGFVKHAKRRFPRVEVCTFFHNVEAKFFLGSLKKSRSVRALAVLIANYLAERKAVSYSDKIICLSNRDSGLLKRLYGRGATHLAPMALEDKLPPDHNSYCTRPDEKFALFVGGVFYANRDGIFWFVKHVVPHIQIKICIVGRGFEDLKSELEREGKVQVVGAVDSLAEWYRNAHFVIAPIFDGSGMKTKVAEALMFGKTIIGTPEAFSGYEDVAGQAGYICTSVLDFVSAIRAADQAVKGCFDIRLRAIYESRFSLEAARVRLKEIMSSDIE